MKLTRSGAYPSDLFGLLRAGFDRVHQSNSFYRQTGVVLEGLVSENEVQYTLFDDPARIEKMARIYSAVDELSEKFGEYTVHHAASLPTKIHSQHEGERGHVPERVTYLFRGENKRQRLGLTLLHIKV